MRKGLFLMALVVAGMAQAQTFDRVFVFLNVNANKPVLAEDSVQRLMDLHFKNMASLGTQGKLINAGPFEGGGGLFVLNTASVDTARQWLYTDPAVKAGRWKIEMFPFTTTEGGNCVVGADYEMVSYLFVRYKASNEIANFKANVNAEKEVSTDALISRLKSNGDLIMAGYFDSNEGGILVLKEASGMEVINQSELAQSGSITFESKTLWIAKGSFCEE